MLTRRGFAGFASCAICGLTGVIATDAAMRVNRFISLAFPSFAGLAGFHPRIGDAPSTTAEYVDTRAETGLQPLRDQ